MGGTKAIGVSVDASESIDVSQGVDNGRDREADSELKNSSGTNSHIDIKNSNDISSKGQFEKIAPLALLLTSPDCVFTEPVGWLSGKG